MSSLQSIYSQNATRAADARWYHDARREISERALMLGVDVDTLAGITAAVSPQNAWDTATGKRPNLDSASRFVATGANVHTAPQMRKAREILAGAAPLSVLRGPKERAFFQNLSRPGRTDAVTVDRWAARAVGANPESFNYARVADEYRDAARAIGIRPDALQAAVWAEVRRQHA